MIHLAVNVVASPEEAGKIVTNHSRPKSAGRSGRTDEMP
jgi:hypothetical protein